MKASCSIWSTPGETSGDGLQLSPTRHANRGLWFIACLLCRGVIRLTFGEGGGLVARHRPFPLPRGGCLAARVQVPVALLETPRCWRASCLDSMKRFIDLLLLLSKQASQVLNPRSSELGPHGLPRRWSFPRRGLLGSSGMMSHMSMLDLILI